jgi:hypothetical protein
MVSSAMSVSGVFLAHGIQISDRKALELIDDALTNVPSEGPSPSAVSQAEAAIYDDAGMPENVDAQRRLSADVAGQFISLLARAIPIAEAAERIGVKRARMQQMVSAREVWAVRRATRWALPAIQFDGDALLPGWSKVARAFPADAHPLEILGFLTTPQPELELNERAQTVPDWLRSGGSPEAVEQIARGLSDVGL